MTDSPTRSVHSPRRSSSTLSELGIGWDVGKSAISRRSSSSPLVHLAVYSYFEYGLFGRRIPLLGLSCCPLTSREGKSTRLGLWVANDLKLQSGYTLTQTRNKDKSPYWHLTKTAMTYSQLERSIKTRPQVFDGYFHDFKQIFLLGEVFASNIPSLVQSATELVQTATKNEKVHWVIETVKLAKIEGSHKARNLFLFQMADSIKRLDQD